jgi:hypothetical protein
VADGGNPGTETAEHTRLIKREKFSSCCCSWQKIGIRLVSAHSLTMLAPEGAAIEMGEGRLKNRIE